MAQWGQTLEWCARPGKGMTAGKMRGGSNVKRRNVSRGRVGLEIGAVSGRNHRLLGSSHKDLQRL